MIRDAFDIARDALDLAHRNRCAEALALCDNIIANWPRAYIGHVRKGDVLYQMGEHQAARCCYTRAIQLLPESAAPYFARAYLAMENGEYKCAAEDLDAAMRRDKGYFGHVLPLLKAECHLQLDELDEAEAECDKIPDGFVYPSFRGALNAGKEHVLFDIQQAKRCQSGAQNG